MELDQAFRNISYLQKRNANIHPLNLDELRNAFLMRETSPVYLSVVRPIPHYSCHCCLSLSCFSLPRSPFWWIMLKFFHPLSLTRDFFWTLECMCHSCVSSVAYNYVIWYGVNRLRRGSQLQWWSQIETSETRRGSIKRIKMMKTRNIRVVRSTNTVTKDKSDCKEKNINEHHHWSSKTGIFLFSS